MKGQVYIVALDQPRVEQSVRAPSAISMDISLDICAHQRTSNVVADSRASSRGEGTPLTHVTR